MPRSSYARHEEGDYILIVDNDGPLSVTNDADDVIADLVAAGIDLEKKRIIYRDSEGIWDGLLTGGGYFAGYKLLGCTSAKAAKAKWERRHENRIHDLQTGRRGGRARRNRLAHQSRIQVD